VLAIWTAEDLVEKAAVTAEFEAFNHWASFRQSHFNTKVEIPETLLICC